MLDVYARQWDRQFIPGTYRGADAEGLLCQHLAYQNVSLRAMPVCLVRVRLGGGALRRDFVEARSLPKCRGVSVLRAELHTVLSLHALVRRLKVRQSTDGPTAGICCRSTWAMASV